MSEEVRTREKRNKEIKGNGSEIVSVIPKKIHEEC